MFTGIVGTTPYMSNQILYMHPNPLTNKPPESMCAESVNLSVSPKIIPGFYYAKVDVYSFAVTCAEILAGQPPFMDISRTPLAVLNGMRPYLPPDLDFRLRDVIQL
jgi:serine/threonine protein kinase